jgi:DNA-directed RNA polymerase specialized sigma24 family protein
MKTKPSGEHSPLLEELLNCLEEEYCFVVRFVMRLGASLHEAELIVQGAFADRWRSMTSQSATWSTTAELKKSIRVAAYELYVAPETTQYRMPPRIARALRRNTANPAYAELTTGTTYVLNALYKLDSLPRSVLAFTMDGFSVPEITALLGIKDDLATGDLLKKARETLRRELAGCRAKERREH